ncbi:alpha-ketoglutarate-dependent sulfonate dioxygenase [Beauveria brongniartii RCEF 3172]|uniref:Alpha-ketoglutarate-dependent sulfonate dioxygenase n=1 Tax=Beauveria brongniartii RCEF 3172 TaxID=1081107 RepID=A0A167E6V1_9HYPO|nr:alpha-ketoglutarate-dependent sulfonate dioxygenase [Beauveria brongniartii RCEF 3172]
MSSADNKKVKVPATLEEATRGLHDEPVPSYQAVADQPDGPPPPLPAITFDDKPILSQTKDPSSKNYGFDVTESCCLAHLKLLHAIQAMKEDVGYTDGLWGIWDSLVSDGKGISLEAPKSHPQTKSAEITSDEEKKMMLSKLREKRWAIFLARAVDRYEAWWNAQDIEMLTEADMTVLGGDKYMRFPSTSRNFNWQKVSMPPLDVLMVMHTHMLNPRAFLEDCMRYGMNSFWATGLPWKLINDAIGDDFAYNASADTQAIWVAQSGRSWLNQNDPLTKTLKCPYCPARYEAPWTTCGKDDSGNSYRSHDLIGEGYGDGKFSFVCMTCGRHNYKELLSVSKFLHDTSLLLTKSVPMPGTILSPQKGRPEVDVTRLRSENFARAFPNRMIRKVLRIQIMELIQLGGGHPHPTMDTIRLLIEQVLKNHSMVRSIDDIPTHKPSYDLHRNSRLSTRKMMSRYWENLSPFALDLCSAVMRQGIFIDKMVNLDWLHSPSAKPTMRRLIKKYQRFLFIMEGYPSQTVVPTLDVDLGWHTHQLHPQTYYQHTVRRMHKFIDHDDKIDQGKLGEAFAFTTKKYQEFFGQVYSECTCWYCETVRSSLVSSIGSLFKTKDHKVSEDFHTSGAAKLCPPDNSAHISAHNAVCFAEIASATEQARRARHSQQVEDEYQKARKRAGKRGRELPPKDEYYNHWGYPYYAYGPWMYPTWFTGGMYYGADPCSVGASGTCAAGTCGSGAVAAGACGGPGGCSSGAGGCGAGGCSSGACGGGGGACGGGGGSGGGGGGCGGGGGGGGGGSC